MKIEDLFANKTITLAQLPKHNELDINSLQDKKLLLIPIDHDYPGGSAAMHNAVFSHYNLDFRTAFVVGNPKNTKAIIDTFKSDDRYIGGGVGSGFKDKAIQYMDELDESAKVVGSINVIAKHNNKLIGYNTDGVGFVNGLLAEYPNSISGKHIVLLGAGGTALPIAYELAQQQPKQLTILNRTIEKAQHLAELIAPYATTKYGGEDEIKSYFSTADIVINTTNKGADPFKEYTAFAPITTEINEHYTLAKDNLSALPSHAIVADILLENQTKTLALAQEYNYQIHNGKSMNLHQAVPAIKLMTGINKPDTELEQIMRDTL